MGDLYAVAKCSHLFEELAKKTFTDVHKGEYSRIEYPRRMDHLERKDEDVLRIFGKSIRSFFYGLPYDILRSPCIWQCFDIAQLTEMSVDEVMMDHYIDGYQIGKYGRFESLTKLKYGTDDLPRHYIIFPEYFPNLAHLTIGYASCMNVDEHHLPRNLKSLDYSCEHSEYDAKMLLRFNPTLEELSVSVDRVRDNRFLGVMIETGSHRTLEKLSIEVYPDDQEHPLETTLAAFTNLKSIYICFEGTHKFMELIAAFRKMPRLEKLSISFPDDSMPGLPAFHRECETFLTTLSAEPFAHQLKGFDFHLHLRNLSIWDEFVKAMPPTCKCYLSNYKIKRYYSNYFDFY